MAPHQDPSVCFGLPARRQGQQERENANRGQEGSGKLRVHRHGCNALGKVILSVLELWGKVSPPGSGGWL